MSEGRGRPAGTRLNAKKWYSYKLFLLILPFMALVFLFSYFPLHGWAYAFFDYRPPFQLKDCEFVGFKWFVSLISNASRRKQIAQVLVNTFAMSGLGIMFSWLPMAFAILLSEIKSPIYKKTVQTMRVADVAEKCGYPSIHSFSRKFTELVGCSPGIYRARCLKARADPPESV